jgi:hypothetical protein
MSTDLLKHTFELIQKDFDIQQVIEELSQEKLLESLEKVIQHLLNHDFQKLLQICYRIDIHEPTLKKILHESPPEEMTKDLAKAILQRQIQKAFIRSKYS